MFYHAHGREELHFLFRFRAAHNFNHNLHCQAEPVGKGLTGCDVAQLLLAVGEFIKDFFWFYMAQFKSQMWAFSGLFFVQLDRGKDELNKK